MILYATKETVERYKIKTPEELSSPMKEIALAVIQKESGDKLREWGCKLLYFDGRKCLQVVNFASKLTLFLIDFKVATLPHIGNVIAEYIFEIYKDKPEMEKCINRFFETAPFACFARLKDKSIIATLNRTQWEWAQDGHEFFKYIKDGILCSKKINKDINHNWIFTQKENGKTEYFSSEERFEELLKERFCED